MMNRRLKQIITLAICIALAIFGFCLRHFIG